MEVSIDAKGRRMLKQKFYCVILTVAFACVSFMAQAPASAQMGKMKDPRYDEHTPHAHGMGVPGVVVELKTTPEHVASGRPISMLFLIRNTEGKPIRRLSIHHDRILHVIIASQDFSVFAHIHPEDFGSVTPQMKRTGQFPVQFNFPKAGRYLIGADFAVGQQLFSHHFVLDVAGAAEMGPAKRDFSRRKRFGDYDVALSSTPEVIHVGKKVMLAYLFKRDGKPVADLMPYLSAPMHVAIISIDLNNFIHAHGEVPGMSSSAGHEMSEMNMRVPARFGPEIDVDTIFPVKGVYQIFGQVQHNGKIILTSFMIHVE
jgi:Cu+-exporting ATPase